MKGKPRQHILIYLGSIPAEAAHNHQHGEWRTFWFKVVRALALKHVSWQVYQLVYKEIGKRVDQPAPEALMRLVAEEFQQYPVWKEDYQRLSQALEWTHDAWAS